MVELLLHLCLGSTACIITGFLNSSVYHLQCLGLLPKAFVEMRGTEGGLSWALGQPPGIAAGTGPLWGVEGLAGAGGGAASCFQSPQLNSQLPVFCCQLVSPLPWGSGW